MPLVRVFMMLLMILSGVGKCDYCVIGTVWMYEKRA